MKLIASCLLVLIVCALVAGIEIQFRPFRIRFEQLSMGLGTLFLLLAATFFIRQGRIDAYQEMLKELKLRQEQRQQEMKTNNPVKESEI